MGDIFEIPALPSNNSVPLMPERPSTQREITMLANCIRLCPLVRPKCVWEERVVKFLLHT